MPALSAAALVIPIGALAGCRQVLGIDDTAVVADAGAADAGSATDGGAADAAPIDAIPPPDATLAACGPSYAPLAGGSPAGATYRGVMMGRPRSMARSQCQADGADLVVVEDAAEAAAVAGLVENAGSPYFWVGLELAAGQWVTVHGEPATYLPWAMDEPTGDGSCVLMSDEGAPHELHDYLCPSTQIYVCECLP